MKQHRTLVIAIFGALVLGSFVNLGRADHTNAFYRARELSVDAFGTGSIGQQTINNFTGERISHDVRLGAGVGLNYFFLRNLGVGAEAYTENTAHSFVDSASLNLLGRLPIADSGFAPYAFVGGGYQFDAVEQWLFNTGVGLEFRFHPHWALFMDARYVFTEETKNYGVGRAGVRISF